MTRRVSHWTAVFLLLLGLGSSGTTQTSTTDLQLILAVDASGSVNQERFDLQKEGYAAAFRNPRVLRAIQSGRNQSIVVTMVQWTGPYQQVLVTTFGKLGGGGEPLRQGIHFKLPWPISVARVYDVSTVRSMAIGSVEDHKPGDPILWATPHSTTKPENLIVAAARVSQKPLNAAAPHGPADQPAERGRPPCTWL